MVKKLGWPVMIVCLLWFQGTRAASLSDVSFMSGHWVGGDGAYEEVWLEPKAGTLTGSFRWVFPHRVVLEFLVMQQKDNTVILRFKHFEPTYETWEKDAPNTYTLDSVSGTSARFIRTTESFGAVPKVLEYIRDGDSMRFIGHANNPEDKPILLEFTLKK